MTPFDWGRWYYYSHRIKYVTNAVIPSIDEVSFANLTASVGQVTVGEPLLPNLRGFTATVWTNSPSNCLLQEFLLRGSYVREVGITLRPRPIRFSEMGHVYEDGDVGDVFIPTFDTLRKDTLSSLTISLFTRHNYSPSISPYILTFRNITRLTLGQGTRSLLLLEGLGQLPLLERLNFRRGWDFQSLPHPMDIGAAFRSLRVLFAPPVVACYVLQRCSGPLAQVHVTEQGLSSEWAALSFGTVIEQLVRHGDTLNVLDWIVGSDVPPALCRASALMPLINCPRINTLRVAGFQPPTNDQLQSFGDAWHNELRGLSWSIRGSWHEERQRLVEQTLVFGSALPTLDAVLALADRCPQLQQLSIPVDTRVGYAVDDITYLTDMVSFNVCQWVVNPGDCEELRDLILKLVPTQSIIGWRGFGELSPRFQMWKSLTEVEVRRSRS